MFTIKTEKFLARGLRSVWNKKIHVLHDCVTHWRK